MRESVRGEIMNRRDLLAALASLPAASVLGRTASAQANPVLIGAHLDQAKQASYYSLLQHKAMNLFLKEQNARGGVLGRPIQIL
jgi:hypothetical protein